MSRSADLGTAELANDKVLVDGADGGTRTRTPVREADFRTTSAFAAASEGVRGLDYPFAIVFRPQAPPV